MAVPSFFSRSYLSLIASTFAMATSTSALASPPVDLFAKHGVAEPADAKAASAAQRAVERVADLCQAPEGMREGPSAAENAQCEKAVAELAKTGAKSAAALLSQLDDQRVPTYAREKLLDVLARTADSDTLAPLVTALERLAQRGSTGVEGSAPLSSSHITDVLRRITIADPLETPPWAASESTSNNETAGVAKAWRGWVDAHKAKTRAELEKLALEGAREDVKNSDIGRAYLGARRLTQIKIARAEGLRALESLKKRSGLTEVQERAIDDAISEARVQQGLPAQPVAPPPRPHGKRPKARSLASTRHFSAQRIAVSCVASLSFLS